MNINFDKNRIDAIEYAFEIFATTDVPEINGKKHNEIISSMADILFLLKTQAKSFSAEQYRLIQISLLHLEFYLQDQAPLDKSLNSEYSQKLFTVLNLKNEIHKMFVTNGLVTEE